MRRHPLRSSTPVTAHPTPPACPSPERRTLDPRLERALFETLDRRLMLSVGGGFTNAGLTGQYFSGTDLLAANLKFTRNDNRVDFDWGTGLPPGGSKGPGYADIGTDNYSVRWTGQVIPRFSETYTFKTVADDGVRLQVKRATETTWTTLVDQWSNTGAATTGTGAFAMATGQAVDVRLEYVERTGAGTARLLWSSPSTPEEVIDPISINGYHVDGRATFMFADMMRSARPRWEGIDGQPAPAQDANGWPMGNGAMVVWEGTQDDVYAGTYNVRFKGRADVSAFPNGAGQVQFRRIGSTTLSGSLAASQIYNAATNTSEFQIVVGGNGAFNSPFFLNLRNTDRDGVGINNDGITDLQIMRPRTIGGNDPHPYGTVFADAFKNAASVFSHYRVLDTNGNLAEREWADRTRPTFFNASRGGPPGLERKGWTYEYEILLANETGKDLYLTIPMRASNDYFTKLAQLLRYGSDAQGNPYTAPTANPVHPPLNPNLKVYLELSNEVWNTAGGFEQSKQADDDAVAAMLAPAGSALRAEGNIINYDGRLSTADTGGFSSFDMNRIRRWHALRSLRMSEQFRAVFAEQMNDRARPVLEFFYNNTINANYFSLKFLDDYFNNGAGVGYTTTPRPLNYYFWGAGGASYYGSGNASGRLASDPIVNPSFDNNTNLPLNQTSLRPTIPGWSFAGNAGVYGKATTTPAPTYTSEGMTLANLRNPETGDYAGYIKRSGTTGTISQNITFNRAGRYAIGFRIWQPQGQGRPPLDFFLDGVRVTPQYRPYTGVGEADAATGPTPINYSWNSDFNFGFDEYTTATAYVDVPAGGTRSVGFSVSIPAISVPSTNSDYGNQAAQYLAFDQFYVASVDRIFEGGMPSNGQALGQPGSDSWTRDRQQIAQQAQAYGMHVVSYESGWSLGGDDGATPVQNYAKYRDPRARQVNVDAINVHYRAGYDTVAYGVYEQWRDFELANAENAPLRQGFVDANNVLPPEPTNGVGITGALTTANQTLAQVVNRNGQTGWVRDADATLSVGEWITWNVLIPSTGNYAIAASTTSGATARLSVDESTTIASGTTGGTLSGTAFLTKGLHTVKIKSNAGTFTFSNLAVTPASSATPVIVPSATRVRVVEGATSAFGVRLDRQPSGNVVLTVARAAGDADVSVQSGGTLTFTPANWNAPQTVTLAAAHDADTTDGTATIRLSATGLAAVDVTAVEVDDDAAADATIPRVTAAPAVDGHVDAVWNAVAAHAIGRTLSGTFAGGSDLTATWRAVYTDQRLYLLVDVTDDQLRNDSTNPWDDDAVELYLDGDASRGTSYDGSNDLQLVFGYGDAAVVGGTNSAAGGTAGVTFATVPTATGYRLEASVPWQPNLGNPDLAVGQRLGIDVHVNDDDDGGGRDGKRAWTAATDNAWANPSLFGTAKLGGTVTADTTPPTVVSSSFDYQTGHRVLVRFSEDVSASLQAGDLTVQIVGGTTTQPLAATAVAYDPATFTATFAYTPPLADGNYRATLAAGAVTDAAGNPLASSHTLDFYVLAGDFNRDRVADFADLGILLNNYNTTGKTFSQGDANYDGAVDFADLGILLNSYNKSLLAPATTSVLEAEPTPPVVTTSTPQPPAKAKPPKVKPKAVR